MGSGSVVESIAASATTPGHVVDVLLVEGKDPAGFGPAFAIHTAQMVSGQHRASYREMATGAALVAVALTVAQLPGHIPLAKMDREQPPDFADKNPCFVSERCHCRSLK
jgi:hypothetical protein